MRKHPSSPTELLVVRGAKSRDELAVVQNDLVILADDRRVTFRRACKAERSFDAELRRMTSCAFSIRSSP